jgi:hypothetical protein
MRRSVSVSPSVWASGAAVGGCAAWSPPRRDSITRTRITDSCGEEASAVSCVGRVRGGEGEGIRAHLVLHVHRSPTIQFRLDQLRLAVAGGDVDGRHAGQWGAGV